jgi:hypothetical protein
MVTGDGTGHITPVIHPDVLTAEIRRLLDAESAANHRERHGARR